LARLFSGSSDERPRGRRWTDRLIGITVGLVLGLGVLVYFVFVHSEGTIDAPKISDTGSARSSTAGAGQGEAELPARSGSPEQPAGGKSGSKGSGGGSGSSGETKPVPIVKVIGGAPPTGAGPKQLTFHKGEKVRFEIETREPFTFEIRGLGITKSIEAPSIITFKATKAGQFPVISTTTLIGVADLLIKSPKKG
jgi:hypothetical protein